MPMLFHLGQIVQHVRFGYRGVIYHCDAIFSLTDEWYDEMAKSKPPKNKPWYGILVDGGGSVTYVAQRHLVLSRNKSRIEHPDIAYYFDEFDGFEYRPRQLN